MFPSITKSLFSQGKIVLILYNSIRTLKLKYREYDDNAGNYTRSPIIVLHGVFGCKRNWQTVSKQIHNLTNPQRKVIAVDARNHGESPHTSDHNYPAMSADLVELMRDLNISKAMLVGHSMGGRTAMYTALNDPNRVEQIVVVDITPFDFRSRLNNLKLLLQVLRNVKVQDGLTLEEGRLSARAQFAQIFEHQQVIDFMMMNMKRNPDGRYTWCVNFDSLYDNFDDFANFPLERFRGVKFERAILLMASKFSDFVGEKDVSGMKNYFPNLQVLYFDAGHNIHAEMPREFVQSVAEFANQTAD